MINIKLPLLGAAFLMQTLSLYSQTLPVFRATDWKSPGAHDQFPVQKTVALTDFGADTSGIVPCDSSMKEAISALGGPGKIFIPAGTYLFESTIALPDSIIIEGAVDSSALLVRFLLSPGNPNHGISITGKENSTGYKMTYPLEQGSRTLYITDPKSYSVGDLLRLKAYDDSALVNNSWARHSTGQIVRINKIEGDSITIDKPLRRSYSGENPPQINIITPRSQVHIKCIVLERLDTTKNQTSNIYLYYASDCSITGIESNYTNFAHVDIQSSYRITVKNSFFRNANGYGGGGKGYGVVLEFTSSDCFIHQNNFRHLRHSMLLQCGANGNVIAYNYSVEPFWNELFLPANAAGDLVLHGNYPYMNLFEGNVVQNIVVDASHGINGPFNTFYRNRAELYGIFMNNSPASNDQNFMGNQVSNLSGIGTGMYALQGSGHYEYGNMIKGVVIPAGTAEPEDTTLFDYDFYSFYQYKSQIPPIKTTNWQADAPLIEAGYRLAITKKSAVCSDIIYEGIPETSSITEEDPVTVNLYPNPFGNELIVKTNYSGSGVPLIIYNALGQAIYKCTTTGETTVIETSLLNPGMYLICIEGSERCVKKIIKK